jgi:hypothetical protein
MVLVNDTPSSLSPSCPAEIRPHIRAALAADPTGEALLDIGQASPLIAIEWLQG